MVLTGVAVMAAVVVDDLVLRLHLDADSVVQLGEQDLPDRLETSVRPTVHGCAESAVAPEPTECPGVCGPTEVSPCHFAPVNG